MQSIFIGAIVVYQRILSPDQGIIRMVLPRVSVCTMYPSCSEYAKISIEKHGVIKGTFRGIKRIIRCGPRQKQLIDRP